MSETRLSETRSPEMRKQMGRYLHRRRKFNAYFRGIITGAFEGMKKKDIAERLGVTAMTLYTWDRRHVDWEHVRDYRRSHFAKEITEVDAAMFRKAKSGDARAAELVYRKIEGWIPTQANLNTNRGDSLTDSDLLKLKEMLEKNIAEDEAESVAARGVAGQDQAGDVAAGNA